MDRIFKKESIFLPLLIGIEYNGEKSGQQENGTTFRLDSLKEQKLEFTKIKNQQQNLSAMKDFVVLKNKDCLRFVNYLE